MASCVSYEKGEARPDSKPIYMVCDKALCDVGQFYSLCDSLRLFVYMQPYFEIEERLQFANDY